VAQPQDPPQAEPEDPEEVQFINRLNSARDLIRNLRVLFGNLAMSDKKYADPTAVLKSLTDSYGKPFEVGEERDIGEFNDCFLSRISEGLRYKRLNAEWQENKKKR
jgi:hypothetical protein